MKQIKYFLTNGAFIALLYFGFIEEIDGAYNVAMFFAWVTIAVSVISISDSIIKEKAKEGFLVPAWVDVSLDIGVVIFLAWFGAWFTCIFWVMHIACMLHIREEVKKINQ